MIRFFLNGTKFDMFCRRGEVTDEFLVEVQPNNAPGPPSQSIVMQPLSNNAHIHTKYYENDVSVSIELHPSPSIHDVPMNSKFIFFYRFRAVSSLTTI